MRCHRNFTVKNLRRKENSIDRTFFHHSFEFVRAYLFLYLSPPFFFFFNIKLLWIVYFVSAHTEWKGIAHCVPQSIQSTPLVSCAFIWRYIHSQIIITISCKDFIVVVVAVLSSSSLTTTSSPLPPSSLSLVLHNDAFNFRFLCWWWLLLLLLLLFVCVCIVYAYMVFKYRAKEPLVCTHITLAAFPKDGISICVSTQGSEWVNHILVNFGFASYEFST